VRIRTALLAVLFVALLLAPRTLFAQNPPGGPPGGGPPGGPAPAGAEKRVEHVEELWYKVLHKQIPVGWSHYTLDKIEGGDPNRAWRLLEERELAPVKGLPISYSARSSVVLTDKWTLTEAAWGGLWKAEGLDVVEPRFSAKLDPTGKLLVSGPNFSDDPPFGKELDWGVESMIGKFLFAKGLAAGKTYVFKMLTGMPGPLYQEIPIQVKDEATLTTDAGSFSGFNCLYTVQPSHSVQKEALTWQMFVDQKDGKIVRLALASGDLVIEAATESVREIQQIPFAARGRRDPFRNPMVIKPTGAGGGRVPGGGGGTKIDLATLSPDDRMQMDQKAADLLSKMQRDSSDTALPRKVKLQLLGTHYDELSKLVSVADTREKKETKWVDGMKKRLKQAQELYQGVERLASDMERIHQEAQNCFETDQYKLLADKLAEAQLISQNPAIRETQFEKEIRAHFVAIKDLHARARKREAFSQKKPSIIGVIYYLVPEPVTMWFGADVLGFRILGENSVEVSRSRSTAIVKLGNDVQILEEGKEVAPVAELKVHRIERHAVVFSYQGELIRVDLGAQ